MWIKIRSLSFSANLGNLKVLGACASKMLWIGMVCTMKHLVTYVIFVASSLCSNIFINHTISPMIHLFYKVQLPQVWSCLQVTGRIQLTQENRLQPNSLFLCPVCIWLICTTEFLSFQEGLLRCSVKSLHFTIWLGVTSICDIMPDASKLIKLLSNLETIIKKYCNSWPYTKRVS